MLLIYKKYDGCLTHIVNNIPSLYRREVRQVSAKEEQSIAQNLQNQQDSHNAALEHLAALVREQQYAAPCYDPRVVAFKERRRLQAGQIRWHKPNNALPKQRKF